MAILRGAICRIPVLQETRQELHSCKFWPDWTGIKAEISVVAAILWSPFLLMVGQTW